MPPISNRTAALARSIGPLWMIFWGAIVCALDLSWSSTTNGNGFKLDLFDDTLGSLLIAIGVFRLLPASVDAWFVNLMRFVAVAAVVAVFDTIRDHFIFRMSHDIQITLLVVGELYVAATVAFAFAMLRWTEEVTLLRPARSWFITSRVVAAAAVGQIALLIWSLLPGQWGNPSQLLRIAAIVVAVGYAIGLICILVSIWKTARNATEIVTAMDPTL